MALASSPRVATHLEKSIAAVLAAHVSGIDADEGDGAAVRGENTILYVADDGRLLPPHCHQELVDFRDGGVLIPGPWYRGVEEKCVHH